MRICFVGAPSTGKSTIASIVYKDLQHLHSNIAFLSEYATEYQYKFGAGIKFNGQIDVISEQLRREKAVDNNDWVVSECPGFLNYIYMVFNVPEIVTTSKRGKYSLFLKKAIESINWYDFILYFPIEFEQEESPVRVFSEKNRLKIDYMIKDFLIAFGNDKAKYTEGSIDNKLFIVKNLIKLYETVSSQRIVCKFL